MIAADWIRTTLPRSWRVARVRDHASVVNGYPFDSELFSADNGMPLVRIRDISSKTTEIRYAGEVVPEVLLKGGEILIGMDGEFNVARWQGGEALLNQRVCCIRPAQTVDARFLYYVLPAPLALINEFTYSTTVKHLSSFDVLKIHFPFPSLSRQSAIADYLDSETAQLDALLAAKQRVLSLLAEKERALITRAVTRGLDPHAPLRDSSIPWLGEIPAHWETPPVYGRFEVQLGKMLDEKKIKGVHLAPYLRNSDVQWGAINTTDLPEMDFDEDDRRRYGLRTGDILVCEGGEVGRSALWEGAHPDCYYQKALHRLRPIGGKDEPAFFVLLMRAIVGSGHFALLSSAATIQHLPAEKLRVVRYPAPPLDEQRAIVAHVLSATSKLDGLRVATERTVTLLRERRTALIASAVTGKIDAGVGE